MGGLPLQGVQVALAGSATASVTTGSDGRYSFTDLSAGGNYTVTPSLANYTFTPPSRSFSGLAANQTADFTATLNRQRIRGHVKTASGVAIPNATVTLSGAVTGTTTTDAAGNYSFADLPAGSDYTVTVARSNYSFAPASQLFNSLVTDVDFDFTGALVNYIIGGRVTLGGTGLAGVTVNLSGSQSAATTTNSAGDYSLTVIAEGNYTVTPSKANYTFAPQSASFNNLGANQSADFTATLNLYSISGRVTTTEGLALSNVTLSLSGSQSGTTTTDASGNYSFANLQAGGNYTVTPSLFGYTFSPLSRAVNGLGADQTTNFAAGPVGGVSINLLLTADKTTASVSTMYKLNAGSPAVINGDLRAVQWHYAKTEPDLDWLEVIFVGRKTLSEVHVFSTQPGGTSPLEGVTFTQYGLQEFDVEFWTGTAWQLVPGGTIANNNKVWVKIAFPPLKTEKVRVVIRRGLRG